MTDHNDASSFDEKRLFYIVGKNAAKAREIAGLTRIEAMRQVWRYKNPSMYANRISELESGQKKIELKTLYRLCEEYGCSADYLLGLSNEYERNLGSSHNGMVFESVRGQVLDATDRICEQMSQVLRYLPPFQGELLKNSAKNLVEAIEEKSHDLMFRAEHADIYSMMLDLKQKVAMFDMLFAKQMRIVELSMMDRLTDQNNLSSLSMTQIEPVDQPKKL